MTEKICAHCGKMFIVAHCGSYLYKKTQRRGNSSKTVYYCGYNCMRKANPDKPFKHSDLLRK